MFRKKEKRKLTMPYGINAQKIHHALGIFISATIVFNMLPTGWVSVYASEEKAGLCEHYTEHTAECGYTYGYQPASEDREGVLDEVNAPTTLATRNVTLTADVRKVIFTVEECGNSCQGHIITQNIQGGLLQSAKILVESGTHDITFSGLNLTSADVGIMPGGTMNLTLDSSNKIIGNNCGFYVPTNATLVITEQSTGSLNISLASYGTGAGIGGAYYNPNGDKDDFDCGMVIINGGKITATGNGGGAGIGGASYDPDFGNGGNIIITGGHVTATGSDGAPGIGGGKDADSDGFLTLSSADVLDSSTTLGSKGKYTINEVPTADMISVPADMHYTSVDMAAEIADKVTLSGEVEICGKTFKINTEGWNLTVTKKSDLEYTASYTHVDKGTISKPVIILPCIHNNGASLTHHDRVEADCTQTGVVEYWDCFVCGKNFSDKDGQTEITDMEIPIAAHSLSHHEKVEADCTHTGVVEYWDCSVCGKNFSDKDGQTEITDTEIPIAAHTLTHRERNEADCTQTGNVEYWDCSVCGEKFSDKDGQTEISDADIVIPVKSHTLTHHAEVKVGCFTDGSMEYWSCDVCNKLFSDMGGTREVTDIKIPAAGHHTYSEWKSNNDGTHTHSCQTSGCGFTETEDCSGGTATYTDKSKCEICGGEYGELLKDAGAPTGEISIGENKWNSFLNTITFGLFFNKTEQVTITAEDKESGVESVSYYISGSGLSEEEVKKLDNWTDENTDKTTFSISPDKSCVVYASITDKQGNVTYISSDGMVFDGTSPAIVGVTNKGTYCTSQTVTVTDDNLASVTVNGNEQTLSDNSFVLDMEFDTKTIVIAATDKAGNITTVTVNTGHNYGTEWKSDSNGHWHECTCGNKSEVLAHTEDSGSVTKPATETETGIMTYKCSVCDYEMRREIIEQLPPSHKHSYGTEWKFDNSNHWHECDCGDKSESSAHTEDGGSLTKPATETEKGIRTYKCSVCGYVMRTEEIEKLPASHTHSYGTEWKSDNSNHWHECSCGEKSGTAAHTWDNGTVTVQPTTESEGVKTFTCTVCGRTRTETVGKLPPSHTHSYGTVVLCQEKVQVKRKLFSLIFTLYYAL